MAITMTQGALVSYLNYTHDQKVKNSYPAREGLAKGNADRRCSLVDLFDQIEWEMLMEGINSFI